MRSISLLLIFTLLVAGFSSLAFAGDKSVSDDHLVDKVRLKLAGDPDVKGGGLDVDVKSGVVSLRGTVSSEKAKQKATRLCKKVRGVKGVDNQLTIKP
ncbi:MAG: BON domain-containing protein [Bryobacterales bacterium]|nr:BON domain-containing protein [Bryobacterales bacterium]